MTPDLSASPQTAARLSTSVSEKLGGERLKVFRFNATMTRETAAGRSGKKELWKGDGKNTGRGCRRDERKSRGLTFFCVARCVLARVAHQAVEVPWSGFQHVKPAEQDIQAITFIGRILVF